MFLRSSYQWLHFYRAKQNSRLEIEPEKGEVGKMVAPYQRNRLLCNGFEPRPSLHLPTPEERLDRGCASADCEFKLRLKTLTRQDVIKEKVL